ncbi:DUF6058 family natural product biosynthesis protein [Flagellimonas sp. HMM57]|uniref:DUF6058 family natural product biosynthesis protein n=1 Tax=unclassified Flagellimonas TaxID=2644544 RepID=UPI0013D44410|nr:MULTISPECIES: DUF6058 family natural product biosynthesis protein [unclassified Flagellimonas]UII76229.1 DUF6058 family natural product biosynthesis protein [Flagellimonas sp. HMM57]
MNSDIRYITENYIDSEELCEITKISESKLSELIAKGLMPNFSYQIQSRYTITSPLGDKEAIITTKRYFPKNIISIIEENLNLENGNSFKEKVKKEFIETFINHTDNPFAYENIILNNGKIDFEKLEKAFEIEWEHYLNGIYGICTLNATGAEIAKKEIAVKKIISFIEENSEIELSDEKKKKLIELNSQYNEVSNLFSPYQRENSSRGKYLDKMLNKNSLTELIKNYS